tara:strand:+ start:261 stop:1394 length:1134 start_codon:yes stop_codon:yes gene_type:complete
MIKIDELINTNCINIGNFTLKNGESSKYYYNIKNIISNPKLLKKIGDELYKKLNDFDIICGIPYGGLPIASYISTTYDKPMIIVRNNLKKYGTKKRIEGEYKKSDRCVIIDDVITSGKSIRECINILNEKVNIVDIGVVFNRQQNPICPLPFKSLFYKNDIVKFRLKKISASKKSNLCFSADIEDPNKLLNLLDIIGEYIVICKIHYDIIKLNDYKGDFKKDLINSSIKHNYLIMEDRKFIDISYIVNKQYSQFNNWVDLVTVHSLVTNEVVSKLSGVLLVANMSNNNYNLSTNAIELAKNNINNVVGFITQNRINMGDLVCMTPGISFNNKNIDDQKYRNMNDVDTDYIIIGRLLYNSNNIKNDIKKIQKNMREMK